MKKNGQIHQTSFHIHSAYTCEGHVNFLRYKKVIDRMCCDLAKRSTYGYLWKITPSTIKFLICQVIIVAITYIS